MAQIHLAFSTTFILGFAGLAFNPTHLLSALLCLEGMMLSLYLAFSWTALTLQDFNLLGFPLILLAFSACEAAAGLALMVATARTHGSDQLQNLNLLQC